MSSLPFADGVGLMAGSNSELQTELKARQYCERELDGDQQEKSSAVTHIYTHMCAQSPHSYIFIHASISVETLAYLLMFDIKLYIT